jgi:hypothetical protein
MRRYGQNVAVEGILVYLDSTPVVDTDADLYRTVGTSAEDARAPARVSMAKCSKWTGCPAENQFTFSLLCG